MAESFAQRHWSEFERLAFELTKDCFNVVPTQLLRTQESKDGGFDSVFVHQLGKLKKALITHETLMEAKLRSAKQSVGLRAFAATMVIAFNGTTQCLVVVTNRSYSPQALAAARDFEWKSRLKIILVDQKTLSAWLRPRLESLRTNYPRELLDDLVLPNPEDEEIIEVEIPERYLDGTEPSARISFGRRADSTLASCQLNFTPTSSDGSREPAVVGKVIGKIRRALVDALATTLGTSSGCAVVAGESGVGKSFLVREMLRQLPASRRCIGIVDLSLVGTSRRLFLTIIAHLTGIDISEAAQEFNTATAKRVFSVAGGVEIPTQIRDAVISTLHASSPESSPDVNHLHLASYLSFLIDDRAESERLIIFHNLDKAPEEVLEFLHTTVPIMTAKKISVLLELTIGSEIHVARERWDAYLRLFENVANLGNFSVEQLSETDAIDLLLEELPGLGSERARFIYERIGNRPLFLHHAALWLKTHRVVAERAHGSHLIETPELFFEGLTPEACVSILDRHIDLWRHEIDLPYADAITAATLLNGRLPTEAVSLIIEAGERVEPMLDALVTTGLFVPEPQLQGVRVSHSLLFERMQAIENGSVPGYYARRFERKRVAQTLLEGVDSYGASVVIRELYRSALLAACERWSDSWQSAQKAGRQLSSESQLALASQAFTRGVEAADQMVRVGDDDGPIRRVTSLLELLEVEDQRYRLGLEQNSLRLATLAVSVRATTPLVKAVTRKALWLRSRYLEWRSAFTRERFEEALSIAEDLFVTATQPDGAEAELAGHAIAALGITLKALERTQESLDVFDKGVALFPDSAYGRMERLSNLAALALRRHPAQALNHYREIIDGLGKALPIRERLHVEGDLAMALFLLDNWSEAAAQASRTVNMADANGIPAQAARGRNILGCVRWAEGAVERAIHFFDRAILDAERSYMERFLWRFRVNLASSATELGQTDLALSNARWAEDRILEARRPYLAQAATRPGHVTSRWYVALLVIGLVYDRCHAKEDQLRLKRITSALPKFQTHLRSLIKGKFPIHVFAGTTHVHGERVMITG